MPRPNRRNGGSTSGGANKSSSIINAENQNSNGNNSSSLTRSMIRVVGILLVVVGAGIVSSSRPLQSCLVESVTSTGTTTSTTSTSTSKATTATETSAATAPPHVQPQPKRRLMWDSTNATVMAYATGYHVTGYKKFVGSLRNSGFKGNIILAVAPDVDEATQTYLESRNVMMRKVQYINCTYELIKEEDIKSDHDKETRSCMAPYADLKARWGRFPLLRDYLQECSECTGPVLVSDLRDTLFQRDPFGSGDPYPTGLQVFQEHSSLRTDNWIVDSIIRTCKGNDDPVLGTRQPMLCSGTTVGTRQAMLDYLEAMHTEMKLWMKTPRCQLKISADDQSIHNYLFYTGKLPYAESIPNRMGIVHTIGVKAAQIFNLNREYQQAFPETEEMKKLAPLKIIHGPFQAWIRPEFSLTDDKGFILDFDGNRSRVVHQYDRFGQYMEIWFNQFSNLVDK